MNIMADFIYFVIVFAILMPAVALYLEDDVEEVDLNEDRDYYIPMEPVKPVEKQVNANVEINEDEFEAYMKAECLAMGLEC